MQPALNPALSLVVPVYGNEGSIPALIAAIAGLHREMGGDFEAVLVVDGSPDRSHALLSEQLAGEAFPAQLVSLSRNFGAFAAIRVGLAKARGRVIAVMAADLQEPPGLVQRFHQALREDGGDVAFGVRESRADPWTSKLGSNLFWSTYRRFVNPDIPPGGVDIFALTARFRDQLLALPEANSSLVAQLFWLGGRRHFVGYERQPRSHGTSGWTVGKKFRYLSDSVFAFTDLPVRLLIALGAVAMAVAIGLSVLTLVARLSGWVAVPGYAGTMLAILFFGAFNALGLGVVGTYAWRAFENTKARPLAIIQTEQRFNEESS